MLTPHTRLAPNPVEVAAKILDGEAIMINLANGMYYSMDGVGVEAWVMIADGHGLAEVSSRLARRYGVSEERVAADVQRLAEELLEERIVRISDLAPIQTSVDDDGVAGADTPYDMPRLNKYSDMAELLALDPPMLGLPDVPWPGASSSSSR